MVRRGFVGVVVIGLCTVLPGCGPSRQQACSDLAAAMCAKMAQCTAFDIAHDYGDSVTCEARETQQCLNDANAEDSARSASNAEACAQAYAGWDCQSWMLDEPPEACLPTIGSLPVGASCAINSQCQTIYCSFQDGTECGTCAYLPLVGDSCSSTDCSFGLLCAPGQTCSTPVPSGGACGPANACTPDDDCVGDTGASTCQPKGNMAGVPCDSHSRTLPNCSASGGLACLGTPGAQSCVSETLVAAGQACGPLDDGGYGQCRYSACIESAGQKTCVAYAGDGEPCDTISGPVCTLPAICVIPGADTVVDAGTSGTCVFPNPSHCQ
jgi:hypothetical protein